jgi:FAD/FMN-containing dehydrogenase
MRCKSAHPMSTFTANVISVVGTEDKRPTGLDRVEDAFPERTLTRLRELKRRYDPANTFRDNFTVQP